MRGLSVLALIGAAIGAEPAVAAKASPERTIQIEVTKEGFVPAEIKVKKGEPLALVVTRKIERTCATEIALAGTDLKMDLPLNTPGTIHFTPKRSGVVKYACAMGMVGGVLLVE